MEKRSSLQYNDDTWVQALDAVGLTKDECDAAIMLLAGKSPAYRQGMLGRKPEDNACVIRMALVAQGEFLIEQLSHA